MEGPNATQSPGRWTAEAKAKQARIMAERHAKKRMERENPVGANPSGGPGPGDRPGGRPGATPPPGGPGDGSTRRGAHLGANNSDKTRTDEEPKVTVDTKKIEKGYPAFLRKIFNILDKTAQTLTGYPSARVSINFEPYTKEESELDAELSWPFVEATLPRWAQRHPFLAFMFVLGATFLGKLKINFRKEAIDARPHTPGDKKTT